MTTLLRMASRDTYLDHLASIPLFSALPKKDLQKIAKASDEVSIEAGRTIVEEDASGHEAYVIVEGDAEVRRKDAIIAKLGAGDHFGELALLDGGPRTATVVALTPMRLLVLGQREFAGTLDEVPGLAHKLMATMATQIRQMDEKAYG